MTRQERRERITEQRKKQIFDAALRMFSRRGFDQATIPDIAEEAGVSVGTIYNYYENKHDLLLEIIKSYMVTESFVDFLEQPPEQNAPAFLYFFINESLNISLDKADVIRLIISEIQRDPEIRQRYIEQVIIPSFRFLEKYLGLKVDQEALRPSNVPVVVRALVGMTLGLSIISKLEGETGIIRMMPRQELVTEVTKLMLEGIKANDKK